jgi:tetratricopeptide (TPR) repeat protein
VPAAVVIVGVLAAWTSGARQGAEPLGDRSLGAVAAQYRSGDRGVAIATVGLWTQGEVERETEGLLESLRAQAKAGASEPAQVDATVRASVALMSDAALRALRQADPRRARWELGAAARLVHDMPTAADFSARFYELAGLMLHRIGDLAGAYEILSEGRRRAGDDAGLLLARGAVIETAAALRTYEPPDAQRWPRGSRDEPRFVIEGEECAGGRLPRTDLADAQAALTQALQREPGLLEARLRLGRVLLLRGKVLDALPELERVGRESSDPAQVYMARMFEGRCRERLGDARGAATAFAAATERVPGAQAGLVALGRALDRLGENQRARSAFGGAMQPEAVRDPWLKYLGGQPDRIFSLAGELRSLVP